MPADEGDQPCFFFSLILKSNLKFLILVSFFFWNITITGEPAQRKAGNVVV